MNINIEVNVVFTAWQGKKLTVIGTYRGTSWHIVMVKVFTSLILDQQYLPSRENESGIMELMCNEHITAS